MESFEYGDKVSVEGIEGISTISGIQQATGRFEVTMSDGVSKDHFEIQKLKLIERQNPEPTCFIP